jgi:hypothetical protein
MPVARHAAADDLGLEHVQRGEQCRRAVALVSWGTCRASAAGRVGWRLALAFFVHVQADDVLDLLGERRIGGPPRPAPVLTDQAA